MSLAAGIHAFRSIIESTPLDYASRLGRKEDAFMFPTKGGDKKMYQGLSKKDYKWLIG